MNKKDSATDESGGPVRVHLKWFNGPKGFGFVVPEDEEIDAFLHITALQRAGVEAVGEGACLLCHIEKGGPRGAQVREVVAVLDHGQQPETVKTPLRQRRQKVKREGEEKAARAAELAARIGGAVKWYRPEKGFGFITPDDGEKDIFIHKSCLSKHGLNTLEPGARVSMSVKPAPKGREVVDFDFSE